MILKAQIVQAMQTTRVMTSSISERWRATLAALPPLPLAGASGAAGFASTFAAALATLVVLVRRARCAVCSPLDTRGAEGCASKGGLLFVNAVTSARSAAN